MTSFGDHLPGAGLLDASLSGIASSLTDSAASVERRSSRKSRTSRSYAEVLLLVTLDRILNDFHRDVTLFPSDDLDAPTFEILVDVKEVLDFLEIVLRQ